MNFGGRDVDTGMPLQEFIPLINNWSGIQLFWVNDTSKKVILNFGGLEEFVYTYKPLQKFIPLINNWSGIQLSITSGKVILNSGGRDVDTDMTLQVFIPLINNWSGIQLSITPVKI